MPVPFLDVRAAYDELRHELDAALLRVAASGRYILGPEVSEFEAAFARFVGTRHCVGVSSGLAALSLALRAMGVGAGHEVIVPSNTFIGTWLAVSHVGATPVPVEPCEDTRNLDPGRLAAAITDATRVVIPVHLYGVPADMGPIVELARRHRLLVLEDAAQAHGARYGGTRVGSLGHAGAWSFYPGKNLGALGDGGAVTTDDDGIAERTRMLRSYGWRADRDVSELPGFNDRLDELQAAVLNVKLRHLDDWNARRRRLAQLYRDGLAGSSVALPAVPHGLDPSWHLFVVRHPRRDALLSHLAGRGIAGRVHYPVPPHLQPAYAHRGFAPGDFPIAEAIHRTALSLPIGPHLTEQAAMSVVDAVGDFDG